jgi:hypothetical protein
VDLERGPFIFVRITEELLEQNMGTEDSRLTAVGNRCNENATVLYRESLHKFVDKRWQLSRLI